MPWLAPEPERRLLPAVACVLMFASTACIGAPCNLDRDCGDGSFCLLEPALGEGRCSQECGALNSCPEGSVCSEHGRCLWPPLRPHLLLLEPTGDVHGMPDELFSVAGEVRFRGPAAKVRITRASMDSCEPWPDLVFSLPGDSRNELSYDFRTDAIPLSSGGGYLQVVVEVGSHQVNESRTLLAPDRCPGCPRISIDEPFNGRLPVRELFVVLDGAVAAASAGGVRWAVVNADDQQVGGPLQLGPGGRFATGVVPLGLGSNRLEVLAGNQAGVRHCARMLETSGWRDDLIQVSTGWSGEDVDLDLHLVPPGRSFGLTDCAAAVSDETRFIPCNAGDDMISPGPETVIIPAGGPGGSYGVAVAGFSAPPDVVASVFVRGLAWGEQIIALGPRDMVPLRGEIWIAGVIELGDDGQQTRFRVIDQIIDRRPVRSPEEWPDFW